MIKEFSAGGLVSRENSLLLVKVTNLKREQVWTFPKGHIEKGETPLEAALREVQEETGWRCRSRGPLKTVNYRFVRSGASVDKRVEWFWMEPEAKVGEPDALEILEAKWVAADAAQDVLKYPSDLELLSCWRQHE